MNPAQHRRLTDPEVPGLELLLDDARLSRWLEQQGQQLLHRNYLRYKPGTSCVLGLRLASGWAFAVATSAAAEPKLKKLRDRSQNPHLLAVDGRRRLLLTAIWGDRDLPALSDVPRVTSRLLPDLGPPQVRTIVYKPHRRWVASLEAAGSPGPVLLRAYRPQRAADAARRLKLARRSRPTRKAVQLPRLLGRSNRWGALAVEYVPGRTLQTALQSGPVRAELAAAGRALATMHSRPPSEMPGADLADPAATVGLVGAVLPHLRDRAAALLASLAVGEPPAAEPALCHGDFSLDQVIVTPQGRLAFVDWDRGGAGTAADDLASLVASGVEAAAVADVYDGYTQVRPLPEHLDWHIAQAKLRRLAEPFRTASIGWTVEVERRIQELEESWG